MVGFFGGSEDRKKFLGISRKASSFKDKMRNPRLRPKSEMNPWIRKNILSIEIERKKVLKKNQNF